MKNLGFYLSVFIGLVAGNLVYKVYLEDYFSPEEKIVVDCSEGCTFEELPEEIQTQAAELLAQNEKANTTYTPPENIYLPDLMFLVVKDTDDPAIALCKNSAYRTVDEFSRAVNSGFVRKDKKLYTLARITYGECIDVSLAAMRTVYK